MCHLWHYAVPTDLQKLHTDFLRMFFLGYTGQNTVSVVLGLFQAALWGAIFGGIYSIFEQSHSCSSCSVNVIVEE